MAFDIVEMPSGSILIKGKLVQKKLTAKSKRLVMLCFPKTLEDVQVLFEHLTLTNKETGQLAGLTEEDQVCNSIFLFYCCRRLSYHTYGVGTNTINSRRFF